MTGPIAKLLPEGVALALSDPGAEDFLDPVEAISLERAVPQRRREFAAGRVAARRAMVELGVPPCPIPMGPDRAPIWPDSLVGSISHTRGLCAAVVGFRRRFQVVGLDLERDEPLPTELIPSVCRPSERRWLDRLPETARGRAACLIFSAKEATYKCQYPLTGLLFGFERIEILPDPATGSFQAVFQEEAGPIPAGTLWRGAYRIAQGFVMTAILLPCSGLAHRGSGDRGPGRADGPVSPRGRA